MAKGQGARGEGRRRLSSPPFIGILVWLLILLCLIAPVGLSQRPQKQSTGQPEVYEVPEKQEDYSGRFTFARIRFDVGAEWAGLPFGDHGPPWSHDYPDAGRHLMRIMSDLSKTDVTLDRNEVIYSFGDPDLYKYPLAYLCEVGYMHLSDKEIAGMRVVMTGARRVKTGIDPHKQQLDPRRQQVR